MGVPRGWMGSGWDVDRVQAFWTGSCRLPDVAGSCGKVTGVFGGALGARATGVPSLWPHDEAWRATWWRGHRTFLGSSHQPAPWASVSSLLLGARGWPDHPPPTNSLGPLLLRSPLWVATASWMEPGPSTFPGSRRATLASIPAGPRTRLGSPRGTSICSCSVSEAELPQFPGGSGPAPPLRLGVCVWRGYCLLGAGDTEGPVADGVSVLTELWGGPQTRAGSRVTAAGPRDTKQQRGAEDAQSRGCLARGLGSFPRGPGGRREG